MKNILNHTKGPNEANFRQEMFGDGGSGGRGG